MCGILGGVPRYCTSVTPVPHPDDAIRFMACFEKIAEWDPGVVEAARLDSGELGAVEPAPIGATVTYDANLDLLSPMPIFNPARSLCFRRIGCRAAAGLRREMQT
jgi:hypothetical protein